MTLPNQAAGLNPLILLEDALVFPLSGNPAVAGSPISGLKNNTQPNIMALIQGIIQASSGWLGANNAAYSGLTPGVPLVLNIIQNIVQKLFGFVTSFPGVSQALAAIEQVPVLGPLIQALTGISGGNMSILTDFFNGKWDIVALVQPIIDSILSAIGLGGSTGNSIGNLFSGVSGLSQLVQMLYNAVSQLWSLFYGTFSALIGGVLGNATPGNNPFALVGDVFTLVGGVATAAVGASTDIGNLAAGVVGGIGSDVAALIAALMGAGAAAIPAYTPANAAVANVQGQVNVLTAKGTAGKTGITDGFDVPGAPSANWSKVTGVDAVVESAGIVDGPAGFSAYRYSASTLLTNDWQVQGSIASFAGLGGHSRLFGGGDTTLSTAFPAIEMEHGIFTDIVYLVTLTGPNTGRVVRDFKAYGAGILKQTDILAIEKVGTLYRCYLNPGPASQPIAAWNDAAVVCTTGAGHREVGFEVNCDNSLLTPGCAWDNFRAFDKAA